MAGRNSSSVSSSLPVPYEEVKKATELVNGLAEKVNQWKEHTVDVQKYFMEFKQHLEKEGSIVKREEFNEMEKKLKEIQEQQEKFSEQLSHSSSASHMWGVFDKVLAMQNTSQQSVIELQKKIDQTPSQLEEINEKLKIQRDEAAERCTKLEKRLSQIEGTVKKIDADVTEMKTSIQADRMIQDVIHEKDIKNSSIIVI